MKDIKLALVLVLLVFFSVSPVYGRSKIGFGIDFLKREEEFESTADSRTDFEDTEVGLRLYYEYSLKRLHGVQLELGFFKNESTYKNSYNPDSHDYNFDDYHKIDLSALFKYNFLSKGDISLYLSGGLGIEYKDYEMTHDDYDHTYQSKANRKRLDLVEQVGIGIEFPLFKRFSIFIEDRFKNKISDGQLRVGFYLLPSKKNVNRRRKLIKD